MAKNKNCAGTYKVSGYVREEVDSYWRTCGAKHEGDNSSSQRHRHQSKSTGMTGGAAPVEGNYDENFIMKAYLNDYLNNEFEYVPRDYSTGLSKIQELIAKKAKFNFSFLKYYKLALDYENQKQHNRENVYIKVKDIDNSELKSYIKNKYLVNDFTDVVIVQRGSQLFEELITSPEFISFLKDNYLKILHNEFKDNAIQLNFNKTKSLNLTIGKSMIYNPKFDKLGNFSSLVVDFYDFDKMITNKNSDLFTKLIAPINNNAYIQQQSGKLTNYILIIPILLFLKDYL